MLVCLCRMCVRKGDRFGTTSNESTAPCPSTGQVLSMREPSTDGARSLAAIIGDKRVDVLVESPHEHDSPRLGFARVLQANQVNAGAQRVAGVEQDRVDARPESTHLAREAPPTGDIKRLQSSGA